MPQARFEALVGQIATRTPVHDLVRSGPKGIL